MLGPLVISVSYVRKGKKHERGARGSIEENSTAKKQNMATAEREPKVEDSASSEGSCEQNGAERREGN